VIPDSVVTIENRTVFLYSNASNGTLDSLATASNFIVDGNNIVNVLTNGVTALPLYVQLLIGLGVAIFLAVTMVVFVKTSYFSKKD
jgi:hypothetical protein